MKILFIVLDGIGDDFIPELGGETPLGAANTPNLDWLAKNGMCGTLNQVFVGESPDSDETHFSLFGYDPNQYLVGRGVFEALGIGFKLKPKDVALRANLGTVNDNLIVTDRRAGRISSEETNKLIGKLNNIKINGIKFITKLVYGHRFILVMRGNALSDKISDADSHKVGVPVQEIISTEKDNINAENTASVLKKFLDKASEILKSDALNLEREKKGLQPANYVLVRGAGYFKEVESFKEKYGLRACCVSNGAVYRGLSKFVGMDLAKEKGGDPFSLEYLENKMKAVKSAIKKYDFVFCHIKGTDTLAEDGNYFAKKNFIEKIDTSLRPILNFKDTLIVITADHATSSLLKSHAAYDVPLLIYGSGGENFDNVVAEKFSEKLCQKGKLGTISQLDLMKKILLLTKKEV